MKPVTVSQLNDYIARRLRGDVNLQMVVVEGEVFGYKGGAGRHLYFTLMDEDSRISCAVWASNRHKIDETLIENGRKIIVAAAISPYAKGGSYSLSVTHIEPSGEGALNAEFERLKRRLEREGLFAPEHKRPIPAFPRRIGVVTSAHGAAVEDIRKTVTQKNDYTDIIVFDTLVQGVNAPESIVNSIRLANKVSRTESHIDTLIVGRGGGSAEDLSCFNDESVARAIYGSDIPVISAVGHENDYTIADFTADARAKTPTAAADMAVMDTHELREKISSFRNLLLDNIQMKISSERRYIKTQTDLLYTSVRSRISEARSRIEKAEVYLNENNPQNIFNKGYSAVLDEDGKIVSDVRRISEGDVYRILMRNGSFDAEVRSVSGRKEG